MNHLQTFDLIWATILLLGKFSLLLTAKYWRNNVGVWSHWFHIPFCTAKPSQIAKGWHDVREQCDQMAAGSFLQHLAIWNIEILHNCIIFLCQRRFKILQIENVPFKNSQRLLKFCQSGKNTAIWSHWKRERDKKRISGKVLRIFAEPIISSKTFFTTFSLSLLASTEIMKRKN